MKSAQVSNILSCASELIELCNDSQAVILSRAAELLSSQIKATRQTVVVVAAAAVVSVAVVVNTVITIIITAITMCRF